MSVNVNAKAKKNTKTLKLRNVPTVLKIKPNGYNPAIADTLEHNTETKKVKRSRWLAGDPKEFIERIKKNQSDITENETLRESNTNKSQKIFENNRYESMMTESDPSFSLNKEEEKPKMERLASFPKFKKSEAPAIERQKLNETKDTDLTKSVIQTTTTTTTHHQNNTSNAANYPTYFSDHFNPMHDSFEKNFEFEDFDTYPPVITNNKFDQAAHPLAMSMHLYNTNIPNIYESQINEGRKSHHQKYNSERGSHRIKKIFKHYFLVKDNEEEVKTERFTYTLGYMKDLKKWDMCKETLLLPSDLQEHLNNYSIYEKVYLNTDEDPIDNDNDKDDQENITLSTSYIDNFAKIAEKNKNEIKQNASKESTKAEIRELLNIITLDNYKAVKDDLVSIVKGTPNNVTNQIKFVEVLFNKAVNEIQYSAIYAKLCKDIDKCLTNKKDKVKSAMRTDLIDTCKKTFRSEKPKYSPQAEDETILKKYLIGKVNFIAELINVQMISKKVGVQCINNLFDKFTSTKQLYIIEAIIVLLDKFATLILKHQERIRPEELNYFFEEIESNCQKLDDLVKNQGEMLHSLVKYKIINLLDKKANGWKPTLYEQSQILTFITEDSNSSSQLGQSSSNGSLYNSKGNLKKSAIIQGLDIEYEVDNNANTDNSKLYNVIKKDLNDWMAFIQNGNSMDDYAWKDIENIYSKHQAYMDQIISFYIDAAYELVPSIKIKKTKNTLHDYFRVLIEYYSEKMIQKEVDATIEVLIKKINQYCVNANSKIIPHQKEVLKNVLYHLIQNKIIKMSNFNYFLNKQYDIVEGVIDLILSVIHLVQDTRTTMMSNFKEIRLYKDNVEIVNNLLS